MLMTARELADRYVEAVMRSWTRDPSLYTADATKWHNTDEATEPVIRPGDEERIALLLRAVPDLSCEDIRVDAWNDGFVIRYVLTGTADGTPLRVPACIVATVREGRIARLEEYLDSAQSAPLFAVVLSLLDTAVT
jgi:ketosteroid isomerase-like protein